MTEQFLKINAKQIALYVSMAICLFILLDAYLAPLKTKVEFITDLEHYYGYSKFGTNQNKTLIVKTLTNRYVVPENLYDEIENNDSIVVHQSKITGSIQKLAIKREKQLIIYDAGFVRTQWGLLLTVLTLIGIVLFIFFADKIKEEYTRRNLWIFLSLSPLALLLFHLDVNIFIN